MSCINGTNTFSVGKFDAGGSIYRRYSQQHMLNTNFPSKSERFNDFFH